MSLSIMTWKEAESKARDLSGATDQTHPNPTTTMRLANMTLKKIALLTSAMDMPWGRNTSSLTNLVNTCLVNYPSGTGAFTSSTKTFSGVTLDQTYCGGLVFWVDKGNNRAHYGLIDSVAVDGTSCVLRFTSGTGAVADASTSNLFAIFKPNPWYYEGANIASLNRFRNIKLVDGTYGNAIRLEPHEFAGTTNIYKYDSSITCEDAGDAIYINEGSSLSSYGTLTLSYDEMPDLITTSSTVLDIRPEHLEMFIYELARLLRNSINLPIQDEKMVSPMKPLEDKIKQYIENLKPKSTVRK